jgi:DEAD/DEAH box helicase domain-containing protein
VEEFVSRPAPRSALADWLAALRADETLGRAVRHHALLAAADPTHAPAFALPEALTPVLDARGIDALYTHQARAITALREGRDVVLATPTASGKSLVYSLPALEACLTDPEARALLLFPLRALEQDQRKKLEADIAALALPPGTPRPRVAIYDGETPPNERRKLRRDPPQLLITTPDMLHLGLLPHHESWSRFFAGLRLVVLDELHAYRGVFGAHVAQVMRRLDRVARHHGGTPRMVCASATIANPGEHAANVTGRRCDVVEADGARRAARHVLLLNPGGSSYTAAARLFRLAVGRGLRTIVFTKARRITELLHAWIQSSDPRLAKRVSSYRAGFLPEERREIERRLFEGELLGVISTSALEMGIDVGGLDVCILVGYPGSQIATWQRAGRVGRTGEAAVALVAQPDALDQYLVAHPKAFFERGYEHAVLDPENAEVLAGHLPCAAAELPLRAGEPWLERAPLREAVAAAAAEADLLQSETGREWFAARRSPHRRVSLRSTGATYTILDARRRGGDGEAPRIGTVGSGHVFTECHAGAIYLHHARAWRVRELDLEERKVWVEPSDGTTYTRALTEKETSILSRERSRPAGNFRLCLGRVKVTTRVTGYERRRVRGQELLGTEPLELPPTSFETRSLWLELPDEIPEALQQAGRHVMGGLHAVEHAALALFPLFALCDRFDVAGITYRHHPELGHAAIFLYDGQEGGVGLAAGLFDRIEALLEATRERLRDCECETGCPGCVHSPRCGNGNRPIDKAGALDALDLLLGDRALALPEAARTARAAEGTAPAAPKAPEPVEPRLVFFDCETQRSAQEVGGWHNAHLMRLALAVTWDSRERRFETFREASVHALIDRLASADLVVGFNVLGFDYKVLRGYTDRDLAALPTFDLLDAIHARLGFRLALGHLGEETLGVPKTADGLQSLRWWQEGRIDEIERYCRSDVALLRDLFEHTREHGHLLFRTKRGERVRLPLRLSLEELLERARNGAAPATPPRPSVERRAPSAKRRAPSMERRAPSAERRAPSVERRAPAHAAVEQLEVQQHQHVAHGWRELADEAARIRQRRQTHHVLDREVHLGDPPRELVAQPPGVLREGRVDRVRVEEQVDAPLADVEESLRIQHSPPYRQNRRRD